jgi:hypothetical protein
MSHKLQEVAALKFVVMLYYQPVVVFTNVDAHFDSFISYSIGRREGLFEFLKTFCCAFFNAFGGKQPSPSSPQITAFFFVVREQAQSMMVYCQFTTIL